MDNFVSVILKTKEINENDIVEAMLNALDAPLAERIEQYGLFESEGDSVVLRLSTPYELDDEESDSFAEAFANRMFEMGYDDFDIETSLIESNVLKRGSKGPKVKKLQYDLGVQPADGDFGPATEKAVKKFQKLYQLKQDGIVGPNTQKMINKTVSISVKDEPEYFKSVPRSDFGAISAFRVSRRGGLMNNPKQVDSIKELQAELKRRNMYKGPIDGKYGPDTKDSVASFQKTKGLYVDGDAGPKTILALMNRDDKITTKELEPVKQPDKGKEKGKELAPPTDPSDDNKNLDQIDKKDDKKFNTLDGPKKGEAAYKVITGRGQGKRYTVYDADGNVLKKGRGPGPNNVPEKDDYDKKNKTDDKKVDGNTVRKKDSVDDSEKEPKKILGLTMYTSNKDVVKDLQGNSTDENREVIIDIITKYKKAKDDLSNEEQAMMLQSIVYIMDYDMRLDFSEKTYNDLKKKIASLKESINGTVGMFEETYEGDEFYETYGWIGSPDEDEFGVWEAEYRGRKVPLNKPMRGDVKKFKVYVKNPKGNIVKVNFGDKKMRIKKSNPKRRKSFRARHNCDNPGPKTKARYWSCRKW